MASDEGVAPAVRSILATARTRSGENEHVSVEARSLESAFERATTAGRVPVIGEIKPTSPTTEGSRRDDPVELAEKMVAGGVAALSVLTEPDHFGGQPEDLSRVREAVDVPVLRKDFVVQESQLDAVRADVVLLIARFLDDLDGMIRAARDRGFQVLVETHTREEVERAVAAGADILGVNNRDLTQLTVDLATFEEVAPVVPDDVTLIAESGIQTPSDVIRMRQAGADGLLVGSAIMDGDVRANTERLVSAETVERSTPDEPPMEDTRQ
jgi:indole-3-glycerol phosphate synthase